MNAITGMLLNVSVGGLVLLGVGHSGTPGTRNLAAIAGYPALNSQGQDATSLIAQDLREAAAIDSATTDRIVLRSGGFGTGNTITYTYNRALGTLVREESHTTQTVLTELDDFAFSLFKRPGKDAAYGAFAPATADNASLVGCHWSCSRKLGGTKLDSERIEMAPTVLRNHH